jgi:hypothetical protein
VLFLVAVAPACVADVFGGSEAVLSGPRATRAGLGPGEAPSLTQNPFAPPNRR